MPSSVVMMMLQGLRAAARPAIRPPTKPTGAVQRKCIVVTPVGDASHCSRRPAQRCSWSQAFSRRLTRPAAACGDSLREGLTRNSSSSQRNCPAAHQAATPCFAQLAGSAAPVGHTGRAYSASRAGSARHLSARRCTPSGSAAVPRRSKGVVTKTLPTSRASCASMSSACHHGRLAVGRLALRGLTTPASTSAGGARDFLAIVRRPRPSSARLATERRRSAAARREARSAPSSIDLLAQFVGRAQRHRLDRHLLADRGCSSRILERIADLQRDSGAGRHGAGGGELGFVEDFDLDMVVAVDQRRKPTSDWPPLDLHQLGQFAEGPGGVPLRGLGRARTLRPPGLAGFAAARRIAATVVPPAPAPTFNAASAWRLNAHGRRARPSARRGCDRCRAGGRAVDDAKFIAGAGSSCSRLKSLRCTASWVRARTWRQQRLDQAALRRTPPRQRTRPRTRQRHRARARPLVQRLHQRQHLVAQHAGTSHSQRSSLTWLSA